jgi:hypothetical protein
VKGLDVFWKNLRIFLKIIFWSAGGLSGEDWSGRIEDVAVGGGAVEFFMGYA